MNHLRAKKHGRWRANIKRMESEAKQSTDRDHVAKLKNWTRTLKKQIQMEGG